MSEFLAPLNYDRARDVLRRLSVYSRYSDEGAARAVQVLKQSYPLIFSRTEQKSFAGGSLLLELAGANVTEPLVFAAHLDAPDGATYAMSLPIHELPMSVPISRAFLVSLLEALEGLLRDGYRPGGDLFIAISADSLSGGEGARGIAAHLKARSVEPCFVLDCGGYVTLDAFKTIVPKGAPLALIGVTEKGLLRGQIVADEAVRARKGRESRRPLNELLVYGARLTRRASKATLCRASGMMLKALSRKATFPKSFLLAHPRLSFPLIRLMWRDRSVMKQFFISETTLYAASAPGVPEAPAERAVLSLSQTIVPGRKTAYFKHRLMKRLGRSGLRAEYDFDSDPSARSEPCGEAWDALETAIEIQFERAVIVPCLSPFVSDGRYFACLGGRVYRFSPFLVTGDEALEGECTITDGALQTAVQFFRSMLSV